MSQKSKRQKRFHQKEVAKEYVKKNFRYILDTDTSIGIAAATPARCSCMMCGNPRKWFGAATIAEQSFWQTEDFE